MHRAAPQRHRPIPNHVLRAWTVSGWGLRPCRLCERSEAIHPAPDGRRRAAL